MTDARSVNTHGRIIGALWPVVLLVVSGCLAAAGAAAQPGVGVGAAFARFWNAKSPQEAQNASADVIASGVSFADAFDRLRRGRPYSANVERGIVHLSRRSGRDIFYYDLDVPKTYDPARTYQVRIQLHGGVNGRDTSAPRGDGSIGALAGDVEQIYVIPYAWTGAPWWTTAQLLNLRAILDSVKRTYNVDENRVALAGVSDGATATYYFAMRDTTPFASFLSLNGFIMVLGNPSVGAEGDLFPNNLLNKPFFMINGGLDPLYPTRFVEPYIEQFRQGGVEVEYWPQPTTAHNTSWWPAMKGKFEAFVHEHPRSPLPLKLTWESTGQVLTNRAHWLVIDQLAMQRGVAPLPDLTDQIQTAGSEDQPSSPKLLIHDVSFGRVDLTHTGNTVEATTNGVWEFTLLISPDAFDLSKPIKVVANGRVVFDGRVEPNLATLMKWAARDNDRTMLFGAELHIKPLE
jgi:hypothetical protein